MLQLNTNFNLFLSCCITRTWQKALLTRFLMLQRWESIFQKAHSQKSASAAKTEINYKRGGTWRWKMCFCEKLFHECDGDLSSREFRNEMEKIYIAHSLSHSRARERERASRARDISLLGFGKDSLTRLVCALPYNVCCGVDHILCHISSCYYKQFAPASPLPAASKKCALPQWESWPVWSWPCELISLGSPPWFICAPQKNFAHVCASKRLPSRE